MTLQKIGDEAGMSRGHVHDLYTGRHLDVLWARGEALLRLHKKMMRKRPK